MVTEFLHNFECIICNTIAGNKRDYERHLLTAKHKKHALGDEVGDTFCHAGFCCEKCNKNYKSRNGLWKHSKTCIISNNTNKKERKKREKNVKIVENITMSISEPVNTSNTINTSILQDNEEFKKLILEVVKSNNDLQKQNSELQIQMIEICKKSTASNNYINNCNNNNSNNKTFNLHFFLNEQCKDAMNISEFVNTFDLQLSDLESVGELGYVEGITKIMVDKLNSMDIYKRPIHCSDAKREILYVKDDNKWEKEEQSNPKLRYAIKTVSFKNMKLANLWSDTYPESKNGESRLNDTYMKLIKQSTGGNGEIGNSEDKIIRRIAKEIIIEK